MKKVYYYCTCTGKKSSRNTTIREVEADSEGICKSCGYYAVASPQKVKDRAELYKLLRIDKEDQYNMYIGESVVSTAINAMKKQEENSGGKKKKYNNSIL